MPDFAELPVPVWRDDLEAEYAALAARLEPLVPCLEIPLHLPWIAAINELKKQRGAVRGSKPESSKIPKSSVTSCL